MSEEEIGFLIGYHIGAFIVYFLLCIAITWVITKKGLVDKTFKIKNLISFVVVVFLMHSQGGASSSPQYFTVYNVFCLVAVAQAVTYMILYSKNKKKS